MALAGAHREYDPAKSGGASAVEWVPGGFRPRTEARGTDKRSRGSLRAAAVLAAGILASVFPAATLAAEPTQAGYVYQQSELSPLAEARSYVLQGTRLTDGRCHYDYPDVKVPAEAAAWEVRDIAIDPVHCRKIVEEGIPGDPDPVLADGDKRITEAVRETKGVATSGEAVTSTASGYNWTWWEDVVGIKVNQDRTNISWSYNGTCSSSGSTSGEWSWNYGSGWQIVSYSGSEYESCSYYRGTTVSHFKNTSFCAPLPTVHTYYYYVRAYGYPSGSIGGSRSTDSVDECLPLWMHYQVRKVT